MGQYTNKGLYNKYDRNHKERDNLDYYATPPKEVLNILNTLNYDFSGQTILEPCCGGGHMTQGIEVYCRDHNQECKIISTDIHDHPDIYKFEKYTGDDYDFLADNYPYDTADWIIMNPPYSTIEPFTIRSLDIAKKGIIMLGRLQYLEGQHRFDNIFTNNPPTDVYIYVDRINCWKGGKEIKESSAQAYAWFVWDYSKQNNAPAIHWIRKAQ